MLYHDLTIGGDALKEKVVEFLTLEYFPHFKGRKPEVVPTREQMLQAFKNHGDKVIICRDDKIKGVAVFVNISDETLAGLEKMDVTNYDIMCGLLSEHGRNLHFVLICTDGLKTMMIGRDFVKRKYKPKTISWWNPDLTKLHIYKGE